MSTSIRMLQQHPLRCLAWLTGSAVTFCLIACATGVERFGTPLPMAEVSRIEPGHTTRSEVLAWLGPPAERIDGGRVSEDEGRPAIVPRAGEEILLWRYQERHEIFGTALLYTRFSQRTLTDTVMIVLDERGVVSHVASQRQTGSGR